MRELSAAVELVPIECPACALPFAVTRAYFDARVADQAFFWCPEACNIRLGVPTTPDRLNEALAAKVDLLRGSLVETTLRAARLDRENERLRATVTSQLVGPATAEEG